MMFREALCVFVLVSAVYCMPTEIEAKSNCGSMFKLTLEEDYRVIGRGLMDTSHWCIFKFTSENVGDCKGTCYMFDHYTEIRDDKVTLTVGTKAYRNGSDFPTTPICSDDITVDVILNHAAGYKYNTMYPNYKFKLNVYSKCGPKGKVVSLNFDDAINGAEGYHHGEDRVSRERNVLLAGILVGAGLAVSFLILVTVTYCYNHHSPDRRPSRSASMRKLGSKQFPREEMRVGYKARA